MSGYHVESSECIQDLGKKLAESDLDPDGFDEAWRSLGVVVAALYRKRLTARPTVLKAPEPEPEPWTAELPAVRTADPIPTANGSHLCPSCGFESGTATASKRHFRRMHGDLMHPARITAALTKLSAREAWERSHGPNLPYPGNDAADA